MIITYEQLKTFEKGLAKRLTIDGETKNYDSYLIPIEMLYYNNLNGRIATYIEEYNDQSDNEDLLELLDKSPTKYNDLIAEFIKKSSNDNEKSFKITKTDILSKGQQNPGVILSDGRIIDGNRRFTAIRELYKETGNPKFAYFEAVWLEAPGINDKNGWKKIKALELNLQFNVDEKQGYDKIDFLVSFYKDTVNPDTKMFDKKQYCYASGIKASEYEKDVSIIKVMLDYLEWRNKPKAFYILKNEKLDGPLEEIALAIKKMSDEEWASKKDYIYHYMTHVQSGDRTRDIRELIQSAKINGVLFTNFKNSIDNPQTMIKLAKAVEIKDIKANTPEDSKVKKEIQETSSGLLKRTFDEAKLEEAIDSVNNEPLMLIDKAYSYVNKVDVDFVMKMLPEPKEAIKNRINELENLIKEIKKALNNE